MSSRRQPSKRRPAASCRGCSPTRRGVTLTELLIVIGLMAFLSSIALVGLWEAQEVARESRARSQVQRIEALLMERWDDYASRAVPLRISRVNIAAASKTSSNSDRFGYERARTNALRETARFELPDRKEDVVCPDDTTRAPYQRALGSHPALLSGYRRLLNANSSANAATWTTKFQGAECLYAILASTYKDDENGLAFFKSSEIGDKDGDGRLEILDPWGNPIEFIRWAPGFDSPLHNQKEVQTISIYGSPNTGKFQLFFASVPGTKSADLNWNATPVEVQTAISAIAGGNTLDTSDPTYPPVQGPVGGPWTVRFAGSADMLVGALSASSPLAGGTGFESVRVTTDFVDPFDPLEAWGGGPPLHPVVVSAGRDGKYGILGLIDPDDTSSMPPSVDYSDYVPGPPMTVPPDNPYIDLGGGKLLGQAYDYDGNGTITASDRGPSTDNISNHLSDASA